MKSSLDSLKNSRPAFSILIAEYDQVAGKTMGLMIAWEFPDVTINIAENGRQGVDLFKEHLPDLVITDVNMPCMDGVEMAREINFLDDGTHFIVLTGYSDKNSVQKFRELGINHYMVKPLELAKLFFAIEGCIAEVTRETVSRSYSFL